jgi:hypothetical protein
LIDGASTLQAAMKGDADVEAMLMLSKCWVEKKKQEEKRNIRERSKAIKEIGDRWRKEKIKDKRERRERRERSGDRRKKEEKKRGEITEREEEKGEKKGHRRENKRQKREIWE